MHSRLLLLGFICVLADCSGSGGSDEKALSLEERARAIHEQAIVLDTHIDIPLNFATKAVDPAVSGNSQVDFPKMRAGGMDAAFLSVYVSQTRRSAENYAIAREQAETKFTAIHRMAEKMYPEQVEIALTTADVRRIHKTGKLVALIGIENGYVIGRDIGLLQRYYDLGARYLSLTHNGHNDLADSCCPKFGEDAREHGGLSALGRDAVKKMNDLGIMIDVAHAAKQTVLDITELSQAPVISSHHALRHFVDIPRNLDDEALLAVKKTGGVVQIVAFGDYLKASPPEKGKAIGRLYGKYGIRSSGAFMALSSERMAEFRKDRAAIYKKWPRASVATLVDHIEYAVKLLGIEHVGIASDFNGGGGIEGWDHAGETFNVTLELVRRGFSGEDVERIWGGNLLRVLESVGRAAGGDASKNTE